jgi:hypothetical protein
MDAMAKNPREVSQDEPTEPKEESKTDQLPPPLVEKVRTKVSLEEGEGSL